MTWYLESLDLEVWKIILFGYTFPTKDVDGGKIRKTLDEYNKEESRKFQLNSRAIYILVCAMDRNEYNRISQCKTAKEIWRILEITHEGTTQVKDSKVRILENDYEMFKMKPNESIVEMFTRFTDVVNGFEGLGKKVSEQDKVSKILRCLPPKWNSKTEAIKEAKNLKELPLEKLIGSLMTYEMKIARREKEMQEESKTKSIALKAKKEKRSAMMATWSQSEDSSDDESENEFANMCFMAFEDQDKVSSDSDSDDDEVSFEYDELLIALYKFGENSTSLKKKILSFKKNLMKSKKIFQKLKLQNFLLKR